MQGQGSNTGLRVYSGGELRGGKYTGVGRHTEDGVAQDMTCIERKRETGHGRSGRETQGKECIRRKDTR